VPRAWSQPHVCGADQPHYPVDRSLQDEGQPLEQVGHGSGAWLRLQTEVGIGFRVPGSVSGQQQGLLQREPAQAHCH
jgi:hypothetical protein